MNKNKENAFCDFMNMIEKSWTYERMEEQEKKRWKEEMNKLSGRGTIKGTYKERWETMQGLYHMYLIGIGYTDHRWRMTEEEKTITPLF